LIDPEGRFHYDFWEGKAAGSYLSSLEGTTLTDSSFDAAEGDQCFEDFVPGSVRTSGSVLVTEEELIEFARRYDPQVFHPDPIAARRSIYGGLVASGWHTAAMAMRLIVENHLFHVASVGSPGVDEVRWLKPVRPRDRLSVRVSVLETRRSESKPDRGLVRSLVEVVNQDSVVVMSFKGVTMMLCRNAQEASRT